MIQITFNIDADGTVEAVLNDNRRTIYLFESMKRALRFFRKRM